MISFTQKLYEFLVSRVDYTDTTWETADSDLKRYPNMNQVSHAENLEMEESRKLSPRKVISKLSRPFVYDHKFIFACTP